MKAIMAINWLALMALVWVFAPVEVLTWVALAALTLVAVLRFGSVCLNATDPWTALDAVALVGVAWSMRLVWLAGGA